MLTDNDGNHQWWKIPQERNQQIIHYNSSGIITDAVAHATSQSDISVKYQSDVSDKYMLMLEMLVYYRISANLKDSLIWLIIRLLDLLKIKCWGQIQTFIQIKRLDWQSIWGKLHWKVSSPVTDLVLETEIVMVVEVDKVDEKSNWWIQWKRIQSNNQT